MWGWLKELIEIRTNYKERMIEINTCQSCEVLKHELEVIRLENEKLINRILEKPNENKQSELNVLEGVIPRNIPWNTRRQILEREDREKAKLMNTAPKPITTEELEKELNVVTQIREEKDNAI